MNTQFKTKLEKLYTKITRIDDRTYQIEDLQYVVPFIHYHNNLSNLEDKLTNILNNENYIVSLEYKNNTIIVKINKYKKTIIMDMIMTLYNGLECKEYTSLNTYLPYIKDVKQLSKHYYIVEKVYSEYGASIITYDITTGENVFSTFINYISPKDFDINLNIDHNVSFFHLRICIIIKD